jgi:hypothetical protein
MSRISVEGDLTPGSVEPLNPVQGGTTVAYLDIPYHHPTSRRTVAERLKKAHDRAKKFVDSLMNNEPERIEGSDLHVLDGVINLETRLVHPIVIRSVTDAFWQACIDLVDRPSWRYRAIAIGSPGIGKTTSTPLLIRKLLLDRKVVVYHVRTKDKIGWCYQFTTIVGNNGIVTQARADVFPEDRPNGVKSLFDSSTYYIVDPGDSDDSSNPPANFRPKVIIVSSPNSCHWGHDTALQGRRLVCAFQLFYPVWSFDELVAARGILSPMLSEAEVAAHFRLFGGVPRRVYCHNDKVPELLRDQNRTLSELAESHVTAIAMGEMDALNFFASSEPKSTLMGFNNTQDNDFFSDRAEILSDSIRDKIYSRWMGNVWSKMLLDEQRGRYMLVPYVRSLFLRPRGELFVLQGQQCLTRAVARRGRLLCVSRKGKQFFRMMTISFPCCQDVRLADDPVSSVAFPGNKFVLFHSSDPTYPIDFIFKDDTDNICAIQVMMGKTYSANTRQIEILQERLGDGWNIGLYYFVPFTNFEESAKALVSPIEKLTLASNLKIYHVPVPRPASYTPAWQICTGMPPPPEIPKLRASWLRRIVSLPSDAGEKWNISYFGSTCKK